MYTKYTKNVVAAACLALASPFAIAQTTPGTSTQAQPNQTQMQNNTQQQNNQMLPSTYNNQATQNQSAQQQQNPGVAAQSGQVSEADKKFVKQALTSSMAEVQKNQIAAEKAGNENVKQTAQQLAQDHARMGQAIQQIAAQKNIDMPEQLDSAQQQKITKLNQANEGAQFEQEYVKETVKSHEQSIKMFESAAREVQDPELKSLVTQALPLLERHARQIAQIPGATEHMSEETRNRATQAQPAGATGQTGQTGQQPGMTMQQPGANTGTTQQPGLVGTQTSPQQPVNSGQQTGTAGSM